MGKRGPSATPTKLRVLKGNAGKRPLNDREPMPPAGKVKMPEWLPIGAAHSAWEEIAPILNSMGLLTTADPQALALLCDAYAEYTEARAIVQEEGMTYERTTEKGGTMIMARPEVGIAADAWRRVRAMLGEFGMTPSSRSNVKTPKDGGKPADPFEEFLRGRKRSG